MPHFKVHGYLINSESKIVISFQMVYKEGVWSWIYFSLTKI